MLKEKGRMLLAQVSKMIEDFLYDMDLMLITKMSYYSWFFADIFPRIRYCNGTEFNKMPSFEK